MPNLFPDNLHRRIEDGDCHTRLPEERSRGGEEGRARSDEEKGRGVRGAAPPKAAAATSFVELLEGGEEGRRQVEAAATAAGGCWQDRLDLRIDLWRQEVNGAEQLGERLDLGQKSWEARTGEDRSGKERRRDELGREASPAAGRRAGPTPDAGLEAAAALDGPHHTYARSDRTEVTLTATTAAAADPDEAATDCSEAGSSVGGGGGRSDSQAFAVEREYFGQVVGDWLREVDKWGFPRSKLAQYMTDEVEEVEEEEGEEEEEEEEEEGLTFSADVVRVFDPYPVLDPSQVEEYEVKINKSGTEIEITEQ